MAIVIISHSIVCDVRYLLPQQLFESPKVAAGHGVVTISIARLNRHAGRAVRKFSTGLGPRARIAKRRRGGSAVVAAADVRECRHNRLNGFMSGVDAA